MWGEAKIGEYNLFGRKWGGWGQYAELPTWEVYNGQEVRITAKFQLYNSLEQALTDWCDLMLWGPYQQYGEQYRIDKNLENFVYGIAGVYATDPEYGNKIMSTINSCGLTTFDEVV